MKRRQVGTVCVDGIESLDSANREEFIKAAKEYDLQLIMTKVADTPLEIVTQ